MHYQSRFSELYITELDMEISNDEDGQSKRIIYGSQWGKNKTIVELINIVTISMKVNLPKMILCNQQHNTMSMNLYMNMLQHEYIGKVKPTWKLKLFTLLNLPKN